MKMDPAERRMLHDLADMRDMVRGMRAAILARFPERQETLTNKEVTA